ncbi:MAG: Fe-S cluster assembly protein SufD [Ignavibacteriaceae bacterium]|jgi:Fe-S cluster assembly protein SufD
MNSSTELKELFIKQFQSFENTLNGEKELPFHQIRKDAIKKFSALNFPSVKDEEWKYTNINPLLSKEFKPADSIPEVDPQFINKYLFDKKEFITLVFINGYFSKEFSDVEALPKGLVIETICQAIKNHPDLVLRYFSKTTSSGNNIFSELNTAFANHGTFVHVEENAIIEKPIQILYVTKADDIFISPRNLFLVNQNAQVKIIETYAGFGERTYFTNQVTEFIVNDNAVVEHVRIQDEQLNAFHISTLSVELEKSSNFSSYNINFGGSLVRNNVNTKFNGGFAECRLNGLYVTQGSQFVDNHTSIDHAKPNCLSNELYKGILNDTSRGVFNGKVFVRQDAQKTNAYQQNKNILLSPDALVNTKPQLEIFADDVKCSHGATVGQLDKDQLFYLKARGIQEKEAKAILIYAFASDVVHSISMLQVRDHLEALLAKKLL